jgi:peptidoglycan hydrolase-like protein with peptidoglycan-binding domain
MSAHRMGRETRIGLLTFAVLSVGVTFNLFFMQGRRVQTTVETAAILRPDDLRAASVAEAAGPAAQDTATPDGVAAITPPQPALRPLPVAVAPPASISRADVVRVIQKALSAQGYEPGTPDGITGLMTRAAIMAYEADNGLALTAEPSEDLMRRMERGAAAVPRKGSPDVKTLEAATLIRNVGQWLAAIGYPVSKNETSMSKALVRAIRDYEASQKMPETGRISAPLVARLARAGQGRSAAR